MKKLDTTLRLAFDVHFFGDEDAGMRPFSDYIIVQLESGDPGGEEGEFPSYIKNCLKDWYDGAKVTYIGAL